MKKGLKITLIIIGILALLALTFFTIDYLRVKKQEPENDNMKATIKAVIVKVNNKHLLAMGIEATTGLYSVGFKQENIEFKQGQEVLIYFDGTVMETYPAQLGNVEKIEIIKEKSDIQIPTSILRYCYSSRDKVNVTIMELTNSAISLTITDTNEIPYDYAHDYKINKKAKNENYTGIGEKIGEDTENSTSGYTGTGTQYIWEEVDKISNIQSKDTEEILACNLPNITEDENYLVERKKI